MRSLIISLALLLGACSGESRVTPEHVERASAECAPHAGLMVISQADQEDESLSCGRYCNKTTGRVQYHAVFSCKDDTKIDLIWFK